MFPRIKILSWPSRYWFWYKTIWRIKKLTLGQGEDYTTVCLLDHDYIKNHYRIIAVDWSRQRELYADSKAIQEIAFFGVKIRLWQH